MNKPKTAPTDTSIETRVQELLSRMTLREKAAQTCMCRGVEYATKPAAQHGCSVAADTDFDEEKLAAEFGDAGIGFVHDVYSVPAALNKLQKFFVERSRLGIPVIFTGEALHGIAGLRGTVFPSPINWGATFDPALVKQIGEGIAAETRSLGIHEILAPNLDVARDPRWGRTEETFGEDTYLSSRMAAAIVSGEQRGDISRPDAVVTEPKHYCAHGIPERGLNCSTARAGRREVENSYLPVFEAAVREGGAYNVMVSYNSIDGDPMMASSYYLKTVLKDRIGLQGYTRADWNGVKRIRYAHRLVSSDKAAIEMAVLNGLDVDGCCDYTPSFWIETILELVEEGRLPVERLDDMCARVLRVKFALGLFDNPYTDEEAYHHIVHCEAHRQIARRAAEESVTLLKNDGTLPLNNSLTSIALIGPSSHNQQIGGYSSNPQFPILSIYEELQKAVGDRVILRQYDGCAITEGQKQEHIVKDQPHLYSEGVDQIDASISEAVRIASECQVIIAVCGDNALTSGEGHDRCDLTLYGRQRELIRRLAALNKPLVLVLEGGRPLDLSLEDTMCNAIMMTWFGGENGAGAIVDALLGRFSPAGRLPISFPRGIGQIPCYYSILPGANNDYMDGDPSSLYAFGHGLSYTTFTYSNLQIQKQSDYDVTVRCQVENTGAMDGDEVVQLYVEDIDSSIVTPVMLLKGFERIHLKVGETKTVSFKLNYDNFKLMNRNYEWVVEPGDFRIMVGAGSNDIRLEDILTLN